MVVPIYVWTGVFTIVGTVIGGLSGSLLAPYITYKWNRRLKELEIEAAKEARRLDFYKIVYPERFKAAKELLDAAGNLTEGVLRIESARKNLSAKQSDEWQQKLITWRIEYLIACQDFAALSISSKWLLNDAIYQNGTKFYINSSLYIGDASAECDIVYTSHEALMQSVHTMLHLGEHELLLTEQGSQF